MNSIDTLEPKPIILQDDQLLRILNRYNPKHRQQKSNLKKKLINGEYSTVLTKILVDEIIFLNQQIALQNRLLDVSKGEIITYKCL